MSAHLAFSRTITCFAAVILCLFTTACGPDPAESTDLRTRWLNKVPCDAPCWESITPGVDTPASLKEKLKANPLVDQTSIMTVDNDAPPDMPHVRILVWGMKSPSGGGWNKLQWNGKIAYSSADENVPIKSMSITTPDLCLREVIQLYGEPDLLFLLSYGVSGQVNLIWKKIGLSYYVDLHTPDAEITPDACGGAITLIAADAPYTDHPQIAMFTLFEDDSQIDNLFTKWKGYGTYPSVFSNMVPPETPTSWSQKHERHRP